MCTFKLNNLGKVTIIYVMYILGKMNLMPVNAPWSMSLRLLYLHMCVQHVVLVGFMVIVVISLTL
jgi:hypothetical protein